jgi:hypothetical protein
VNTQLPIDLEPTDADLFGHTTCATCDTTMPQSQAVTACMFFGGETHTEHFCCNPCRDQWRNEHLEPYSPVICGEH